MYTHVHNFLMLLSFQITQFEKHQIRNQEVSGLVLGQGEIFILNNGLSELFQNHVVLIVGYLLISG